MSTRLTEPGDLIDRLLRARSIAIVGASDDGRKASGRTLRYLLRYGYTGAVYPVNPKRTTVQGVTSYARLADLPATPDLAVVVLPAEAVPDAVRQCGAKGIEVAIVFASGFAEVGGEGMRLDQELRDAAREAGVRVLGPNCVGAVGVRDSVTAAFMTGLDQDRFELADHGVGFVTQSGAMGAFILNMAQSTGIGLGRFVSTGNEADISLPEMIEGMVEDPSTRVVLGYVEGVRDGRAFRSALARARERHVPVALMKVGRSPRGATAAQSHTGALAGQDAVYDGIFEQYGVFRAHDVEHLLDLGRILTSSRLPAGPRVSIVTLSGGAGILMTDAAADVGLEVPAWDDVWAARMAGVLPAFGSARNPIDTTGAIAADQRILEDAVDVCLEHPGTDVVVVMLGNMEREEDALCEMLAKAARKGDKPVVVVWVGGSGRPAGLLSAAGIPTFPEPVRAMRAVAALVKWSTGSLSENRGGLPDSDKGEFPPRTMTILDEVASKALLRQHGVPTVNETEAVDADGATLAAESLGYPVVVKLLSDEVAHKSDHGWVRTGLRSAEEARKAADEVLDQARLSGVTDRRLVVQQQIASATELILGMTTDPVFGPVVALGTGGVLTELVADVQIRVPPLDEEDVRSMVKGLRHRSLLEGARGRSAVDLDALTATVVLFAQLAVERGSELESLEINPLLIDRDGRPVAVDALAVLRRDIAPMIQSTTPGHPSGVADTGGSQ